MAQTAAPPAAIPAALAPTAVAGPGINVADLEGQKTWYEAKLGMRVISAIRRDGEIFEYIMGYRGGPGAAIVVLMQSASRPRGPNGFSRLILTVPDAKGLAGFLTTQGVANREVVPDVAYFITDPEGNPIELYTPAKR